MEKLKRLLVVSTVTLILATTQSVAVLTLPIADDANTDMGDMRVTGSITLESDVNLYGARFTYGIADGLAAFAGLGLIDPDGGDTEPFLQLGGQYRLPIEDLPFDLAVRGGFGYASFSEREAGVKVDIDIWILNGGLLASMDVDIFTVYGFLGLSYQKIDTEARADGFRVSRDDTETELALGGGILFPLNDQISFYGELMHIDNLFISIGGRFDF